MKLRLPIQLSIPNPCHEEWAQMTPDERGRFCSHCRKSVVDFTGWTDTQLHQFFTKQKEDNICGRLSSLQINRDIYAQVPLHGLPSRKSWLAASLLLLFGTTPADTKANDKNNIVFTLEKTERQAVDTTQKITGRVLDEMNKPILGAIIELSQRGKAIGGTSTDEDGYFEMDGFIISNLKFTHNAPDIIVKIAYTSYITQEIKISVDSIFQHITTTLQPSKEDLASVIVLGGKVPIYREKKKPNFFRSTWAWVKRIF